MQANNQQQEIISHSLEQHFHEEVVVKWLALLFQIREFPRLNIGPKTGYRKLNFSCFSSVFPGKCRDNALN
jgi:hypothetical protein